MRANAFAATPQMAGQLTDADPAKNVGEGGYLNFRGHPAVLPPSTGKSQLYIPTQYHNMHADRFSPDSAIQLSLRKLEFSTERINATDKAVLSAVQVHDPTKGQNNPPWLGLRLERPHVRGRGHGLHPGRRQDTRRADRRAV